MQSEQQLLAQLTALYAEMQAGFSHLPEFDADSLSADGVAVLSQVASRLHDNYPYHHPLYAGQMLKPPHPVARLAYMLALWVNPNNHALDGGRASSRMEKEAVASLATMVGWEQGFLGHLTSGGTVANLEALWVGECLRPGTRTLASAESHYTHRRISGVLGNAFTPINTEPNGRLSLEALKCELDKGDVGTVVATLGTTGIGAVDPLDRIVELRDQYAFQLHVDAAYGGYFCLTDLPNVATRNAYAALSAADSIVIDPHKHGLQPYGCGAVLFRDASVRRFYDHKSSYTYFSSDELHLGEITLECSRAGASAVALWATQNLLPMTRSGEFAAGLNSSLRTAARLYDLIQSDPGSLAIVEPELDIVVWAPRAATTTEISAATKATFAAAAERDLHLATMELDVALAAQNWTDVQIDSDTVTVLRSVLMKPAHADWLDEIWSRYLSAKAAI